MRGSKEREREKYNLVYLALICVYYREKVASRKPKRLARSQIPTKPVEMPAGIESLDVQVCLPNCK